MFLRTERRFKRIRMKKQLLSFLIVSLMLVMAVSAVSAASIWTDKEDYAPGEVVLISGEGFIPNSELSVDLTRPDGTVQSCDSESCHYRFLDGVLTADENGEFSNYQYDLNGVYGKYSVEISDSENTASTTFTDWIWINWARLNAVSHVTVNEGETITATLSVNTWDNAWWSSYGEFDDWRSTAYRIEGGDWVCVNTPDHFIDGTYQESFTITAPSNAGTYDIEFIAYSLEGCYDPTDWAFMSLRKTLTDGITVLEVDNEAPVVSNIQHAPTYPTCGQDVEVCLDVTDASAINLVRMNWDSPMSPARGGFVDLEVEEGNTYCGILSSTSTNAKDMRVVTYNFYVRDSLGNSQTVSGSSYTYDCADPTADAGEDQTVNEGALVFFDGSDSSDTVTPTNELVYAWTFGDGSSDSGKNPSHIYGDNGVYTATLTVTDHVGRTDSDTVIITVNNVAPRAEANGEYNVDEGSPVTLQGYATDVVADLSTLVYKWDLDNDDNYESEGINVDFRCLEDDTYTVELEVTDKDGGKGYDTATINCANVAPAIDSLDISPNSIDEEESTTLTATVSDPGADDTNLSYTISWGDSSADTTGSTSNGQISVTHKYMDDDDDDQYTITLTVEDSDAAKDSDSVQVEVLNLPPRNVDAGANQNAAEGDLVCFDGTATDVVADQGSLVYHWDFGGPGSATGGSHACITYPERGTYTVTLTVTDKDGGSETDTLTVNVYDYKIELFEGWNLISIPLVPEHTEINFVFATIINDVAYEGDYVATVLQYDAVQDKWFKSRPNSAHTDFGWESSSELGQIIPGYGYYIKMARDSVLYLNGEISYPVEGADTDPVMGIPPSVTLGMDSWNLIGVYGLQKITAGRALRSLTDEENNPYYDVIYDRYATRVFRGDTMRPTEGYWLSVKKIFGDDQTIEYKANYVGSQD